MSQEHLVLLGDSILDNAPYTRPRPDTTSLLRQLIGERWIVELVAFDGSRMVDIAEQVMRIDRPSTAVLSIGGNDATKHIGMLSKPATSSAAVIGELLSMADDFGRRYEAVLDQTIPVVSRLIVCTIYEVRLEPQEIGRLARVPIALLNDRILRAAAARGLDVLDLRAVCTEDADFTLEIEPSALGAAKIAHAIAGVVEMRADRYGRVFGP